MAKFEIKHRDTGAVLFSCELPAEIAELSYGRQIGYATTEAFKAGANLAGAYLADAYLAVADLAGAYLARADLARADLARANLAGANLAGAYLAGAYLAGAYLAGAYLAGALNSSTSEPLEPYVRATKPEHYSKRAERYRTRHPEVPVIADLDSKILAAIESGNGKLDMSRWHTCETTHCRAGWAIHMAGEAGAKLEIEYGPAVAGRMIYLASTGRAPHFYATNERAMEDIKARAAEQVSA